MKARVTGFVLRRYWLRQIYFPLGCLLICLPMLVLAQWQQQVLGINRQLLQQQGLFFISKVAKPAGTVIPDDHKASDFLYQRFQDLSVVFKQGLRLHSVDWQPPTFWVQAQALSEPVFLHGWNVWLVLHRKIKPLLWTYQTKKHVFFKAKLTDLAWTSKGEKSD